MEEMIATDAVNAALEELKKKYNVGNAFDLVDTMFVPINGIAVRLSDVVRLANGQVTLDELKHPGKN
jgi:hypothetical protein